MSLSDAGDEMLTVKEVAAELKVSTATVYKLVDQGELPHVRVLNSIRIRRADLRLPGCQPVPEAVT